MRNWTQDPRVVNAVADFDRARAIWQQTKTIDSLRSGRPSLQQDLAHERMRAADRAYMWTRDEAIARSLATFIADDSGEMIWPAHLAEPVYAG